MSFERDVMQSKFAKLKGSSLALLVLVAASRVGAEVPNVTSMFPAGLKRGTTAEFKLNGKSGTQPTEVWSTTADLNQFQFSEKGDVLTLTASENAAVGLHWIRVFNSEGATPLLPIMVGSLNEILEAEPNNSADEAQTVEPLPLTINGSLHKSGEVDTFAVTLKRNQTLTASVDALEAFGSPMDAVLQILDKDGFVIIQNDDDHGFDPLLQFSAPQDGKYLVRIFCFPSTPNSTIQFAGGADYVYRLTLTTSKFQVLPDWSKLPDQSLAPGLHHFFATHSVEQLEPNDGKAIAGEDLPGQWFEALDADQKIQKAAVALKKGDALRVQVLARQIGSLLDPVLIIRKSDGSVHKETDDPDRELRDIDYSWTAPADGEYLFEVSDRFQHFGERYYSLLFIDSSEPRVELTVAADHFEADRNKPLEIPITVNRLAGFKSEIEVSLANPPLGVTFEPVASKEEGDSAKTVTLKLDVSSAETFQGPIEVVGTYGETGQEVPAVAQLKVGRLITNSLWLTILDKPDESKPEPGN